jgi:mRNA (2'-O-methyladenosine-N6-)-methyltransferase
MRKLIKEFYINEQRISKTKSKYPDMCIPISADIRDFKFKALAEKQMEITDRLFDVIMMDPPWQLSSSQPTRGVAIAYDTLNDNIITDIPVEKLQTDGFIFIWTINAKFKVTLELIKQWGYK